MLLGAIDDLLRQRVDDQDAVNPLYPKANRYRAINKAASKIASLIDRVDEGHRVKFQLYTSTDKQNEYPLPDDFERIKQVVDLQEDGTERVPPRTNVPWVHRYKYERASVLEIVPTTRRRGTFYSYRNKFLVLIPTPNQTSNYQDVKLWYLPMVKPVVDQNSEIDLPEFCTNLLVAEAAVELLGPTGDDLKPHLRDVATETENVQERATPRTDDGPMRIADDRGDTSFSLGF